MDAEVRNILQETDEKLKADLITQYTQRADGGSSKHQLALGRFYLEVAKKTNDAGDATKAVNYLVLASRQGEVDATESLRYCIDKNFGITDDNREDVDWCVDTPEYEKMVRTAARRVFQVLNPLSDNALSRETLLENIDRLPIAKREKHLLEDAAKRGNSELTEDDFIQGTIEFLQGKGRRSYTLGEEDQDMKNFNELPFLKKVRQHPWRSANLIADKVVDVVGDKGLSWAVKLIPTHQINMIILLFFYSLMSVDVAFIIATLLVFYISFAAMVLSTLQMFYKRKKLNDIRDIASFLQNFNSAFDKDTARSMYEWTSIKPYVAFFCSVSICVAAFAVTDRHYIPCPELVLISLFFTSLSFMALSDQYERLEIASIGLNLFASIPAMFESFPHIPIISTLCRPLFGFVISFEFPSIILRGMHVNIGLPSLAYLVVPMLFMAMAMRRSWRGTYVVLIPHLVCFCWWQAMLVFYRYSSWVGLIRASVGWVLFLVMLPVLAFVVVGYLFFYAVYTVGMADFTKLVITMMLVVVPAGAVYWMRNGFSLPFAGVDRKSLAGKVVFIGVLAACVFSVFFMLSSSKLSTTPASRLSYESYYKHCGQPSWEKTSMLDVMLRCTKFQQLTVDWEGTFTGQTTIKEVSSSARQFLEAMPSFFANWLTCVYGQPFGDCSRHDSPDEREFCELATSQGRECHLNNLDRYTFQFTLTMPHGQQIRGEASYVFKSILLQLRPGDTIAIHGHLVDGLGSASPLVRVQYIECTSCSPRHRYMCEEMLDESVRTLGRLRPGFTEMWNFFFAPVLQFDRADG